jgi:PleD family two-component response regulator
MRRLREAVEIPASFGVAIHQPGDDPEQVVMRADEALYETKRRRGQAA